MKKLDLIQENPFEKISLDSIRYNTVQSHCLVVEVYDHATVKLYRVEEDGYKQYTFDDDTHIGLIAPYEFQTEWDNIDCWDFISHRMEALRRIGKMEKPRILPEWLSEFPGYEPVSVMWPWECECKPIKDEIGYTPTTRQMRSWMRVRKSDEILWNYYLTRGKGIAPKQWHNHPWVDPEDDEP
tara:strand:+ start:641 stop:1189 length:549 start_codon:yes stop_codon:yes gene_type:complete